jgi:hypothetical protein
MTKSGTKNYIRQTLDSGFVLYGNNCTHTHNKPSMITRTSGPISEHKSHLMQNFYLFWLLRFFLFDLVNPIGILSLRALPKLTRSCRCRCCCCCSFAKNKKKKTQMKISCVEIIILSILHCHIL